MTLELGMAAPSGPALRMALSLSAGSGRAFRAPGAPAAPRKARRRLSDAEAAATRAFAEVLSGRLTLDDEEGPAFEPDPAPKAAETSPVRVSFAADLPLMPFVLSAVAALAARGASREIVFEGSTHAPDGASFEVAAFCFLPLLERMGAEAKLELEGAGFIPRGGGSIRAEVLGRTRDLEALSLATKDALRSISIFSGAPAAIPVHVQQRQAARARSGVAVAGVEANVQLIKLKSRKAGSVVAITGIFGELPIAVSAVSRRGGSVESVGIEAASEFRRLVAAPPVVPPVLVEPLLTALAFAPGRSVISTWRLPAEAGALVALTRAFTDREVRLEGKPGRPGNIVVEVADPPA